jgi:N-hydroxyarylamine O-acetyltransferase
MSVIFGSHPMLTQNPDEAEGMNLESYFDRIGFRGHPQPDFETLAALHLLHPAAIPFENLSTLLGDRVQLTPNALAAKLIRQRRGGYCFEQNSLFLYVLDSIGFNVLPLAARVIWNQDRGLVNPRTHMALLAEIAGDRYLCDVGFGGATLTAPLAFVPAIEQATPHEPFRILAEGDLFRLEVKQGAVWRAAYEFDLQPQQAIDYEAMNHYVQTHPDSHFRTVLMAARPDRSGRFALNNNQFTRYRNGKPTEIRSIETVDGLKTLLETEFQISLPEHRGLAPLLERIASANDE